MSLPPETSLPSARRTEGEPSVSVVVISYNYDRYLAEAIDSALAQTYPVEVLVVDDGSTDDSPTIIESYGDRVRTLWKTNGGNSSVVNTAVPATRGEVVMFLDADDTLHPDAAAEVARAWRPGCAKVQFRLSLLDAAGHRRGVDPPAGVAMPEGDVVPELLRTGRYVTPVTTGNAFSRAALDQLLPIPEDEFRNTNDGYLNPLIPFFGPVVSIDRELGGYRLHGGNLWAFSGGVDLAGLRQRLTYDRARASHLERTAERHGHRLSGDVLRSDPVHLFQRLVSLRRDPGEHPFPGDAVAPLVAAAAGAARRADVEADPIRRAVLLVGTVLAAVLPRAALPHLASLVLISRPRSPAVRFLARLARRVLSSGRSIARGVRRRGTAGAAPAFPSPSDGA